MPVPQLPYKRPFFTITLNPHEIEVRARGRPPASVLGPRGHASVAHPPRLAPPQEDLALIITNTKRGARVPRRQTPPPERQSGRGAMDRDDR